MVYYNNLSKKEFLDKFIITNYIFFNTEFYNRFIKIKLFRKNKLKKNILFQYLLDAGII